ncbi:MAG: hypothetical protein KA190_21820 [Kofleriaceae bacterium]|nr:hypothetical protein [Kofleriaceae bacterium]
MNWSDAGERLWTLAGPALTGAQAVLIRVDPDWTGLELLASPEWCDAVVPLDATAFGFTPAAVVSLGPWLDQLDALTAGPATWRINPWALRLADPAATEAAQASVDALVAGLREVALVVAARLGPTPTPIAVLTGLAAEVGVVTVSAAAPGLVLPVQDGDERAYVALGPGRRAELYTSSRRRWIDHPDGLQPGGRGAEDHELWEVPERLDGLDLITRHLSGEPVELPAPRGQAVAPRQPGPAASAAVIDEVIVALEAALAPQLSGPDADALLAPGLGGLVVAMQPWGLRLFFSEPRSVVGVLFARPLARLELRFEQLGLDPARAELGPAIVAALPQVPALARRLAGRVFACERTDQPVFDVVDHHVADRPWAPRRRDDQRLS